MSDQDCRDIILYALEQRSILTISQLRHECSKYTMAEFSQSMKTLISEDMITYHIEELAKYSGYKLTNKAKKANEEADACAMAMGYGEILADQQQVTIYGNRDEFGGL